jgi:phage-related protein
MGTVGIGVYEIRIHTAVEHRVFYIAKRTRQTRQADIDPARRRLADVFQAWRR